jgi:hypothetical protein
MIRLRNGDGLEPGWEKSPTTCSLTKMRKKKGILLLSYDDDNRQAPQPVSTKPTVIIDRPFALITNVISIPSP